VTGHPKARVFASPPGQGASLIFLLEPTNRPKTCRVLFSFLSEIALPYNSLMKFSARRSCLAGIIEGYFAPAAHGPPAEVLLGSKSGVFFFCLSQSALTQFAHAFRLQIAASPALNGLTPSEIPSLALFPLPKIEW
jgi:hypothetical protein